MKKTKEKKLQERRKRVKIKLLLENQLQELRIDSL